MTSSKGSRNEPHRSGSAPATADAMEWRLRALHDLLPDAHNVPGLTVPYINFLRSLRERLHPIGVRHIRTVKTASHLSFDVDLGERLGSDFYYGYLGELFEAELLLRSLEPGATLIDAGANFGYYAVSAGARIGPHGTVFAFEPDPAAFKLLKTNVAANRLTNVRCHQLCLGAEDGHTDFYVMAESAFSGMVSTGRSTLLEKRTLPMRSLDSFLNEIYTVGGKKAQAAGAKKAQPVGAKDAHRYAGARTIVALKIDVEGSEFAVLRGSRETIRSAPEVIVMIEVNAKNLDAERRAALESELRALYEEGFRGWIVDASADGIRLLSDPGEAAGFGSANLFIVRSGSASEARLRANARELRLEALPAVVGEAPDGDELLYRNAEDPRYALNLGEALIGTALRSREGEVGALTARLAAAEREGQILREELLNLEKELEALRGRLASVEEDSQARLLELQRRGAEATKLREGLEGVERDSQARLAELERRIEEAKVLAKQLAVVEEDSQARQAELERRSEEAKVLAEQLAAVEEDSQARQAELERRSEEARVLAGQLAAVEEDSQARLLELQRRGAEATKLREQLEAVERESQAGREELEKRTVEVQALQVRLGTLDDENRALQVRLGILDDENRALRARLGTLEDENHARLTEIGRLSGALRDLNGQLTKVNDRLRDLTDQLSTTQEQEQVVRRQLSETQEELRVAREEHERITHAFEAEVDTWKREAELGIGQRIWRGVRRSLG